MENRRNFIKTSGLLAGTLLLKPNTSQAYTNSPNYRTLGSGKHAIQVSALGLGCMGMSYHRSFVPDQNLMIKFIHQAKDLGINFFDTAEAYGPQLNEKLVGKAVSSFRKEIIIATKFGFVEGSPSKGLDSHPKTIKKVVEQSLKNLNTDYIDLLYQHRVDPKIPIEDVAGTVKDLIQAGKVKHFGLSEASETVIRKAHKVQAVTALQSEYSLFTRTPENDVIPVCQELGIGFVPYSPLSRGLLTGYLNEHTVYNPDNDNRPSLPRYNSPALGQNWPLITTLSEFGNYRGLTTAQVGLAWLLAQKKFIVPIPGTTKLAHLKENWDAIHYTFQGNELSELTEKINRIKIVGERYTGISAEQTKK